MNGEDAERRMHWLRLARELGQEDDFRALMDDLRREGAVPAESIAAALRDHYPTTGMSVARGVTCQCGYWNGDESPGVDRPAGAQGRDGLNWHRAQVVLGVLAGREVAP